VLVRTSNPGSDTVQSHALTDGRTVAQMIADLVAGLGRTRLGACGLSDVGAVVAATKPQDAAALRARMPDTPFLIPGYGAQGGTAADLQAMRRAGPAGRVPETCGMLVTSSRAVIYAKPEPGDASWPGAVSRAARRLAQEVKDVVIGL
jgi:orotidine-5'-phosphate decarboxylase